MECRELLGEFEDLNDSPDAVYRELSYSQQVRSFFSINFWRGIDEVRK